MKQAYRSVVLGGRLACIALLSDSLGEQSLMRLKSIGATSQSESVHLLFESVGLKFR